MFGFLLLAMTTAAIASLFVKEDEKPERRWRLAPADDECLARRLGP